MRDPITIGRYHSAPPRRVLRSLNQGYQGDWQSWAGTPRQMRRLADEAERPHDARRWFRDVLMIGIGAVLVLAWVTR